MDLTRVCFRLFVICDFCVFKLVILGVDCECFGCFSLTLVGLFAYVCFDLC